MLPTGPFAGSTVHIIDTKEFTCKRHKQISCGHIALESNVFQGISWAGSVEQKRFTEFYFWNCACIDLETWHAIFQSFSVFFLVSWFSGALELFCCMSPYYRSLRSSPSW